MIGSYMNSDPCDAVVDAWPADIEVVAVSVSTGADVVLSLTSWSLAIISASTCWKIHAEPELTCISADILLFKWTMSYLFCSCHIYSWTSYASMCERGRICALLLIFDCCSGCTITFWHLVDCTSLLVFIGSRSEEHTSELQSRPHISYAVFCLKKKKKKKIT